MHKCALTIGRCWHLPIVCFSFGVLIGVAGFGCTTPELPDSRQQARISEKWVVGGISAHPKADSLAGVIIPFDTLLYHVMRDEDAQYNTSSRAILRARDIAAAGRLPWSKSERADSAMVRIDARLGQPRLSFTFFDTLRVAYSTLIHSGYGIRFNHGLWGPVIEDRYDFNLDGRKDVLVGTVISGGGVGLGGTLYLKDRRSSYVNVGAFDYGFREGFLACRGDSGSTILKSMIVDSGLSDRSFNWAEVQINAFALDTVATDGGYFSIVSPDGQSIKEVLRDSVEAVIENYRRELVDDGPECVSSCVQVDDCRPYEPIW